MLRAEALSRVHSGLRDEAGGAMIEMALCASLVLLVIVGSMQCAFAVYAEHFVESSAAEAARYAMIRGSSYAGTACASTTSYQCAASASDITNYVVANVDQGIDATKITVAASWPGTTGGGQGCNTSQGANSPGCTVTVTVTYPFSMMLPAPLGKTVTFTSTRSTIVSQ